MNDVMHRKRRILGILKKVSWVELSSWLGRRRLTFTSLPRPCGGCHTCWGWGRWKSQNRKNVYLSPYVEEPLNSKVIKSFVPELRSRYVFFVFRDSYVLCIYVMNILCTFHISVSWVCYMTSFMVDRKLLLTSNSKSDENTIDFAPYRRHKPHLRHFCSLIVTMLYNKGND